MVIIVYRLNGASDTSFHDAIDVFLLFLTNCSLKHRSTVIGVFLMCLAFL